MQLSTTFRHMDASQAVRKNAEERIGRILKYLHGDPLAAHAVFAVEKGKNHMAEFSITLPNGIVVQARETTGDMYSSIELAAGRIERQVRKWKEKNRDHKPHGAAALAPLVARGKREPAPRADFSKGKNKSRVKVRAPKANIVAVTSAPLAPPIRVVKEPTFTVRPLRVEDAVLQMNLLENDFFIFADVDNHGLSVVYRRKDGEYGLIETGARVLLPS